MVQKQGTDDRLPNGCRHLSAHNKSVKTDAPHWLHKTLAAKGTPVTIEEEFDKHIREQHRIAKQATGYKAPAFIKMLNARGAVQTAHDLLASKTKIHDGLTQLVLHNRLDLSLEANIIKLKWRCLFSDEEREIAVRRLRQLNYRVEEDIESTKTQQSPPERRSYETNTIIRDQGVPKIVKELYGYKCQVCSVRLEAGNYWYAEAAHIQALGNPHNGTDTIANILCLCPNHHKLFDIGGFYIEDNYEIPALNTSLHVECNHKLDPEAIRYHRNWCKSTSKALTVAS